jgi:tRNA_anti-like
MHIESLVKTIVAILVVLIILLVIAIRKKRFVRPVVLLILVTIGFGAWQGYKEYYRLNRDLSTVDADIKISATDLIHDYEKNDSASNKKYLGKIVEVTGYVKDVKKDEVGNYTIVLGDSSGLSSVRCAVDTTHQQDAASLSIGSSAIVRGNCTGFNKDEMGLGSDVILNFGVVIKQKN